MIIKNIERFRELIPTVTGKSLEKYTQPISDAAVWLRQQIVGPALMRVIEQMQDEASVPELFTRAELVVAYKAYLIAIPKMDVIETSNGFAVVMDDKLAPASRDRVNALITSMQESLSFAVDDLIEYLEDSEEYRTDWIKSPAYMVTSDIYIPTLRTFRRYGTFPGGCLDFMAACTNLRSIIVKNIEPVISRELSAAILGEIRSGSISPQNEAIIGDLCQALAAFYNQDAQLGDMSVCRAREVVEDNPNDYPAFTGSIMYRRILANKENELKNKDKSIHVMI